jgi:hypothetical protein
VKDSIIYYKPIGKSYINYFDLKTKKKNTLITFEFLFKEILKNKNKSNRVVGLAHLREIIDNRYFVYIYAFGLPDVDTIPVQTPRFDLFVFDNFKKQELNLPFPDNYKYIGFQSDIHCSYIYNGNNDLSFYITSFDTYEHLINKPLNYLSFLSNIQTQELTFNNKYLKFLSKSKVIEVSNFVTPTNYLGENYIINNVVSGFSLNLNQNGFSRIFAVSPNDSLLLTVYEKTMIDANNHQQKLALINTYTNKVENIELTKKYCLYYQGELDIYFLNNDEIIIPCADVNIRYEYLYKYNIHTKIMTKLDIDIYD